jgi:hypothetical protein
VPSILAELEPFASVFPTVALTYVFFVAHIWFRNGCLYGD